MKNWERRVFLQEGGVFLSIYWIWEEEWEFQKQSIGKRDNDETQAFMSEMLTRDTNVSSSSWWRKEWAILKEMQDVIRAVLDSMFGEVRDDRNKMDEVIVIGRESNWCFHDREGLWLPTFIWEET